jgi:hypothetical protein
VISESVIDRCLNRIAEHFGARLVVRPPAVAADLAKLEALVGPLPRDMTIFLRTCNGLRLDIDGFRTDRQFMGSGDMVDAITGASGVATPHRFVPVHGDPTVECDYVVLDPGAVHGLMVRWEPFMPDAEVVATSFGHYFDAWTTYMTDFFDSEGHVTSAEHASFDGDYVLTHDPDLVRVRTDSAVTDWLKRIAITQSGGADFE